MLPTDPTAADGRWLHEELIAELVDSFVSAVSKGPEGGAPRIFLQGDPLSGREQILFAVTNALAHHPQLAGKDILLIDPNNRLARSVPRLRETADLVTLLGATLAVTAFAGPLIGAPAAAVAAQVGGGALAVGAAATLADDLRSRTSASAQPALIEHFIAALRERARNADAVICILECDESAKTNQLRELFVRLSGLEATLRIPVALLISGGQVAASVAQGVLKVGSWREREVPSISEPQVERWLGSRGGAHFTSHDLWKLADGRAGMLTELRRVLDHLVDSYPTRNDLPRYFVEWARTYVRTIIEDAAISNPSHFEEDVEARVDAAVDAIAVLSVQGPVVHPEVLDKPALGNAQRDLHPAIGHVSRAGHWLIKSATTSDSATLWQIPPLVAELLRTDVWQQLSLGHTATEGESSVRLRNQVEMSLDQLIDGNHVRLCDLDPNLVIVAELIGRPDIAYRIKDARSHEECEGRRQLAHALAERLRGWSALCTTPSELERSASFIVETLNASAYIKSEIRKRKSRSPLPNDDRRDLRAAVGALRRAVRSGESAAEYALSVALIALAADREQFAVSPELAGLLCECSDWRRQTTLVFLARQMVTSAEWRMAFQVFAHLIAERKFGPGGSGGRCAAELAYETGVTLMRLRPGHLRKSGRIRELARDLCWLTLDLARTDPNRCRGARELASFVEGRFEIDDNSKLRDGFLSVQLMFAIAMSESCTFSRMRALAVMVKRLEPGEDSSQWALYVAELLLLAQRYWPQKEAYFWALAAPGIIEHGGAPEGAWLFHQMAGVLYGQVPDPTAPFGLDEWFPAILHPKLVDVDPDSRITIQGEDRPLNASDRDFIFDTVARADRFEMAGKWREQFGPILANLLQQEGYILSEDSTECDRKLREVLTQIGALIGSHPFDLEEREDLFRTLLVKAGS